MDSIPNENRQVLHRNVNSAKLRNFRDLRIIHFTDVYNIEENESVGGAARFKTALDILTKNKNSIILFSGDAVSPSRC